MKSVWFYLLVLVAPLAMLGGCAPKAAPVPLPTAAAPQAPAPVSTPAVSTTSPGDAAWAKVVAEAKREGVVVVYSSAFVADVGKRLARDFNDQFAIRVEILGVPGSASLEKVKVEQQIKQPIADVMQSSIGSVTQLVKIGLAGSVSRELPALRDKSVFQTDPLFSPGGEAITYTLSLFGALVNAKLVKPEDLPKSSYDFLDPKWKGQLVIQDPRITGGGLPWAYTPRYHKVLDLEYFRRVAEQKPVIFGGAAREMYRMVARGEFLASPSASDIAVAPIMKEGAPLKLLPLAEGSVAGGEVAAVVKGPPHPNAGRLFINWLLSPPGQMAYHDAVGATPFRKDVPDFLIPEARIKATKLLPRTWEAEEWTDAELKAGTMKQIFGEK